MLLPFSAVLTQIMAKGFFSPWTLTWRTNRGKCRDGAKFFRIFKSQGKRPMSTHTMTENPDFAWLNHKLITHQLVKLLYDIALHLLMVSSSGRGCMYIDSRASGIVPAGACRQAA